MTEPGPEPAVHFIHINLLEADVRIGQKRLSGGLGATQLGNLSARSTA
jgi:hypothetical protein